MLLVGHHTASPVWQLVVWLLTAFAASAAYVIMYIIIIVIITSGLAHLHSAERHNMLVPWTRTQLGRCSST